MIIIGLTGGSGSGKGFVSLLMQNRGIPSLDTDQVCRQVCMPGEMCLNELIHAFGTGILTKNGCYDRQAMTERILNDADQRKMLNRISHRHILYACRKWLAQKQAEGFRSAIIDAPLLYESGFDRECDFTVAVLADPETRIMRIMKRDGISQEIAEKRLAVQKNNEFYLENCTEIIYNNEGYPEDELNRQIDAILLRHNLL